MWWSWWRRGSKPAGPLLQTAASQEKQGPSVFGEALPFCKQRYARSNLSAFITLVQAATNWLTKAFSAPASA